MTYLLDTATWANSVTKPSLLPPRLRKVVGNPKEVKALSSMSLLECAIHHRRGRLEFRGSLKDFFIAGLAQDIELIDITPEIAAATNELPPDFPGDPFDRAIAATARILNLRLITPDPIIRDAQFCSVEYYHFRPTRTS